MATWTDKTGTTHHVEIDVPTARRLRDECNVDLLQCLLSANHIQRVLESLTEDPVLPMTCVAIVEDIDDVDGFAKLFNGQALQDASGALIEAIIDFFPEPQKSILRRLWNRTTEAMLQMHTTATAEVLKAIDDIDLDLVLKNLTTPGSGSSESLESSGTTATA